MAAGDAYPVYTLAAKRLLSAGHASEAVMGAAFGLGALVLLPALLASQSSWLLHADGLALALFLGIVPTAWPICCSRAACAGSPRRRPPR